MKSIFVIAFLFTSVAFGKQQKTATLTDGNWSGNNNVYLKLIPYGGSAGFGGSYEKSMSDNFGVGASVTVLPEKNDPNGFSVPKLVSVGGNVFVHLPVNVVDFYMSPGLNLMIMEMGAADETTIGGSLAIGAVANITRSFALGLEFSTQQAWFNKESYLLSRTYFMTSAITAKFTF